MTVDRSAPPTLAGAIDVDVHNHPASIDAVVPYLDDHWREVIAHTDFAGPPDSAYPPGAPTSVRPGITGTVGADGAGDVQTIRDQVLNGPARLAVLTCTYAVDSIRNPYAAAAMARAANDWQVERWLEPEPRLRASIVVPIGHPQLAVEEIERVGEKDGFVQVILPLRSPAPYGTLPYHPVFRAATDRGLAVALHFGGAPGNPPTASGWPSYYIEEWSGMAAIAQTQLTSLVFEGVFERFPELRVAILGAGFAWLPQWTWRADKDWQMLRREVPWVHRPPSGYLGEHVRLGTGLFDVPHDAERFARLVTEEPLRLGSLLMHGSDFPHAHDERDDDLLAGLPPALRNRIVSGNAREFYRLPEERHDPGD